MLASMRAELLVLRKWPAAWGLMLVAPLLVLVNQYVAELISYLSLTPADYGLYGTPSQDLPSLLPGQFNIIAVFQFTYGGAAPFIVLGALMAGGDWERGTIATALLQAPGRIRAFAGQALALAVAVTASVLATFAVAAAASNVISQLVPGVNPYLAAMPPNLVIAECIGAALFVALTYGMLGLFLGTVCRSGAAAMAVALLWTILVENTFYDLGLDFPHGIVRTLGDLTPGAATSTVTGLYGTPGGGADSQNYLPISVPAAVWTLAGWLAGALAVTILILRHRDAVTERSRRLQLRRHRPAPAPTQPPHAIGPPDATRRPHAIGRPDATRGPDASGPSGSPQRKPAVSGVLAALRAELMVMRRRPAVWALVLLLPGEMLLNSYLNPSVVLATINNQLDVNAPLVLASMMPNQFLAAALNGGFGADGLGEDGGGYLAVLLMLLGALVGGSDWGRGTIRTALLQGPGRLRTCAGQALALAVAVAASVTLTFALAAGASAIVALHQTGSLSPAGRQFPVFPHLVGALATALVLALAYAAVGWTLGIWLRSASAAFGAVLLWFVVAEPTIEFFALQLHGVILRIYDILPDAGTNTLLRLYGVGVSVWSPPFPTSDVAPALAFLTLGLYVVAFLAIPALLTRRRDVS